MNQSIIKRIRALLAKASSTSSIHEAEACSAKAHELLAKHNLALADMAEEEAPDRMVWETPTGMPDAWVRSVWSAVAVAYFCKPLQRTVGSKKTIELVGAPHNVAVSIEMSKYLVTTVRKLARNFSSNSRRQRQFCNGAAAKLSVRLHDIAQAKRAPADGARTTLPAVYDTEKRLNEEHVARLYGELTSSRAWIPRTTYAFTAGAIAAGEIGLNEQVSKPEAALQLT
ncbi:conserved hypothetical protein [Roseibium sp. TrichSKD4]|uniref:DUF2786 domain-containing protein n=1 Tax=Roseibium sp. TrichSKD4 TaxID=744980 RepID=UPI0001E5693D|nr:DUF2786 domain-containing protein [Roseibium sp. TrichSKD4]EFO32477.1 conserved hypothetical protein [Roseibium sp. TrichSKD4]